MIRSSASIYREKLVPSSLDLTVFSELAERMGDAGEFLASPELDELVTSNMFRLAVRQFQNTFRIASSQAEILARRHYSSLDRASRATFDKEVGDRFKKQLYGYLLFLRDGERIYVLDEDASRHAVRSAAHRVAQPMPPLDAAFEMIFQGQEAMDSFIRAHEAIKPQVNTEALRADAGKMSMSAFFVPGVDSDGRILSRIAMRVYMPEKRGGRTSFYLQLQVSMDGVEQVLDADLVSRDDLVEDPAVSDSPRSRKAMMDLAQVALSGCALLVSGDLEISPPTNKRRILSARAKDKSLPKAQRERSSRQSMEWPDIEIRPTGLAPHVVELPDPRASTQASQNIELAGENDDPGVMEEHLLVLRDSAKGGTTGVAMHDEAHPQRIMKTFLGLGNSRALRSPYFVGEIMERVQDRIKSDFGPDRKMGSEGVKMDQMALEITPDVYNDMNGLVAVYQEAITRLPADERPLDTTMLHGMIEYHRFLNAYISDNRQCFLLNDDLVDVLGKTDVGGILVEDVALPYRHFFLGFQKPAVMEVGGQAARFDGAYVSTAPQGFELLLTFSPDAPSGDPVKDFMIPIRISLQKEPDLLLSDAILRAIDEGGYDLDRGDKPVLDEEAQAYADEMGIRIVPTAQTSQELLVDQREAAFESMVDAVGIVANTLILLTAKPGQIRMDETWSGLSERAVSDLTSDRPKLVRRGRAIASSEGAAPVRLIRLTDAAKERLEERRTKVRGSPSVVYDRIGHWKKQAYGPKYSLRRLIWVEPTTCNIKAGVRADGSVYVYRKSEADEAPSP